MILLGTYPFLVYVANMFEPGSNVIFKVRCHRFLSYYDSESKNYITETCKITEKGELCKQSEHLMEHYIKAGDRLAFPLYFGNEYLEISLDLENGGTPPHNFQIVVGPKAKCYPNDELGPPEKNTYLTLEEDEAYGGGKWEIEKDETDWELTIKKYGADPETDDVVIGAGPPA